MLHSESIVFTCSVVRTELIVMLVAHANILSSPLSLLNMKYTLYSAQYSCYPNRKMNLSLQNWQDCCYLLMQYGEE